MIIIFTEGKDKFQVNVTPDGGASITEGKGTTVLEIPPESKNPSTSIDISNLTLDEILALVMENRQKQHNTITAAAESLGIDVRTFKRYLKGD